MKSSLQFNNITWVDVRELGISQLYLSQRKLNDIQKWFDPTNLINFQPLPVHDFGNGRLTLTDGHSRAFTAYKAGMKKIPIIYDWDEIVTAPTGQMLYKNDIVWCERFGLRSVCDLKNRIVSNEMYQKVWNDRCDAGFNLLTKTTERQRIEWETQHKDLFLYGASNDLTMLYFEDIHGNFFSFKTCK